ncbi:uncharacterized protein LOC124169632 isoform X2 [Ischnura elegans]|uniref:uncharacterized protein LOC124169632 isoform X2 n=1 Tax=Ischnura elegans TaxID=197161 RepID=UPI001ED8793F|nr:uncharacterized protein LOC124169632 isoform X2 [Ischnura elegans]
MAYHGPLDEALVCRNKETRYNRCNIDRVEAYPFLLANYQLEEQEVVRGNNAQTDSTGDAQTAQELVTGNNAQTGTTAGDIAPTEFTVQEVTDDSGPTNKGGMPEGSSEGKH